MGSEAWAGAATECRTGPPADPTVPRALSGDPGRLAHAFGAPERSAGGRSAVLARGERRSTAASLPPSTPPTGRFRRMCAPRGRPEALRTPDFRGCGLPTAGPEEQPWGHLSHKRPVVHTKRPARRFVPDARTAAAGCHPQGWSAAKTVVAQRKSAVIHRTGRSLLLRLCFYKNYKEEDRDNQGTETRAIQCAEGACDGGRRNSRRQGRTAHALPRPLEGPGRPLGGCHVGGGRPAAENRSAGVWWDIGGCPQRCPGAWSSATGAAAAQRAVIRARRKSSRTVSGSGRLKK